MRTAQVPIPGNVGITVERNQDMTTKQELITEMLAMQKKFMEFEQGQEKGVDPVDYYLAGEGHPLHNYHQRYRDIAMQLVDLAHGDKGSKR